MILWSSARSWKIRFLFFIQNRDRVRHWFISTLPNVPSFDLQLFKRGGGGEGRIWNVRNYFGQFEVVIAANKTKILKWLIVKLLKLKTRLLLDLITFLLNDLNFVQINDALVNFLFCFSLIISNEIPLF